MHGRISAANVKLQRVYERHSAEDGSRILVERLWPRGIKKEEEAAIDLWAKEISPSHDLRKWFGHDLARWQEFRRHYADEVAQHSDELTPETLKRMLSTPPKPHSEMKLGRKKQFAESRNSDSNCPNKKVAAVPRRLAAKN